MQDLTLPMHQNVAAMARISDFLNFDNLPAEQRTKEITTYVELDSATLQHGDHDREHVFRYVMDHFELVVKGYEAMGRQRNLFAEIALRDFLTSATSRQNCQDFLTTYAGVEGIFKINFRYCRVSDHRHIDDSKLPVLRCNHLFWMANNRTVRFQDIKIRLTDEVLTLRTARPTEKDTSHGAV